MAKQEKSKRQIIVDPIQHRKINDWATWIQTIAGDSRCSEGASRSYTTCVNYVVSWEKFIFIRKPSHYRYMYDIC